MYRAVVTGRPETWVFIPDWVEPIDRLKAFPQITPAQACECDDWPGLIPLVFAWQSAYMQAEHKADKAFRKWQKENPEDYRKLCEEY
jgi:hypothetical protein